MDARRWKSECHAIGLILLVVLMNFVAFGGKGNGGGMYLNGGNVSISAGQISSNSASGGFDGTGNGGGIYNNAGSLTINNNSLLDSNKTENEGGGMYLAIGSTTTFGGNAAALNPGCTFSGDSARVDGNGVYQQTVLGFSATINNWAGAVDKCDGGGVPFKGP
jgi:hypothetical protein